MTTDTVHLTDNRMMKANHGIGQPVRLQNVGKPNHNGGKTIAVNEVIGKAQDEEPATRQLLSRPPIEGNGLFVDLRITRRDLTKVESVARSRQDVQDGCSKWLLRHSLCLLASANAAVIIHVKLSHLISERSPLQRSKRAIGYGYEAQPNRKQEKSLSTQEVLMDAANARRRDRITSPSKISSKRPAKNPSVLQYHFKTMDGLLEALHLRRIAQTRLYRSKLLERALIAKRKLELRDLCELMIRPALELARRISNTELMRRLSGTR